MELLQSGFEQAGTGTHKVLLYGWDSSNLAKVRIGSTPSGAMQHDITTINGAALSATNYLPTRMTDGTNYLTPAAIIDMDSGAGTEYAIAVSLRKTKSGGGGEYGTATDPFRVDPTGTTTQPTNLAQVAGTTTDVNTGNASAGTQRVVLASNQPTVPVSIAATITVSSAFSTRSDTYTGTGNGTTVNLTSTPVKAFSIQVKGTGAGATTWDVRLEGSNDGTNFQQILQHTNTSGDGAVVYSGATLSPTLYMRSRCAGLVLGGASNIVVTILGVQ